MNAPQTPHRAPSHAAHAALVRTVLDLVAEVDPRLEPWITIGWQARARRSFGSALLVPAGAWYAETAWWSSPQRPPVASAKRAPQPLAALRLSAPLWPRMRPAARGETIAHELAHLSDLADELEGLSVADAGARFARLEPHGAGWRRWCRRYVGRALPVAGCMTRELTDPAAYPDDAVVVPNAEFFSTSLDAA